MFSEGLHLLDIIELFTIEILVLSLDFEFICPVYYSIFVLIIVHFANTCSPDFPNVLNEYLPD
jgi:hypothetical protein